MKKTIFTFCSIAIVCCAIFFACAKDDNSITHVTYVTQTSGGTGGNPNPNGLPSSSGYGTTTATTAASTTGSTTSGTTTSPTDTTRTHFSIDGTAAGNPTVGSPACSGSYYVTCFDGSGTPSIQITFPGTTVPAGGNYTIVSGTPSGNQCNFLLTNSTGSSSASAGTVTVTILGTSNTAAFTSIACSGSGGSHVVSGAIKY